MSNEILMDGLKRCLNLLTNLKLNNNFSEEDLYHIGATTSFCNALLEHFES
jgi:hypothetical protein